MQILLFHDAVHGPVRLLQIGIRAYNHHDDADDEYELGCEPLRRVLCSQLDEHERGKDDADGRPDGGADHAEDKLNVGDEDAESEGDEDHDDGDDVEPSRRDVVGDTVCGTGSLKGAKDNDCLFHI